MKKENYKYYEEENGEFPFPYIERNDGKRILSIYECCEELNNQEEIIEKLQSKIEKLLKDNDHKFWKMQFMHQYNTTQLIVSEIGRAINEGYEVSDRFKKYIEELNKFNEEGKKYAEEQERWIE